MEELTLEDRYREATLFSMLESDYGLFKMGWFSEHSSLFPCLSGYSLQTIDCQAFGWPIKSTTSFGCDLQPKQALLKAYFEGLERMSLGFISHQEILSNLSYRQLSSSTYTPHPNLWTLCAPWQYEQKHFPLIPYDESTSLDWISVQHAWRTDNKLHLVPLSLVSFSSHLRHRLYFPTSSGCAFGWTYQDACQSAALELIERDTFLLYWRCFLSGIKLDLGSPQDAKLQRLLASIQIPTQQIQIYLLLGEFLIPVICAVFFGRGPNQPQVVISTASSFHLENAIFRALVELSQIVSNLPSDRLLGNLNTLNKSDDQLVDDFLQHGLYYLKKENFSFLSFLFENSESSNIPEMRKLFEQGPHQNFEQLVAAMKKKEYDLMFKSYLTPEIQRIGGYVVRALCPPLIPLDFRHKTRALGGKRYINFQDNLNIKSNIVESQNLNQKPHPLF